MKRFFVIVAGVFMAGYLFGTQFDTMTNDLANVLKEVSTEVGKALAKNMGYYTGAGNVTPANVSGFLGLKVGFGAGVTLPSYFWPIFFSKDPSSLVGGITSSNAGSLKVLAQAVAGVPLLYDMIYAKIGLPFVPMDVGLRLGFFPEVNFGDSGNSMRVGFFHVGGEARYKITGINLVFAKSQIEARLSYDYNQGVVGGSRKDSVLAYAGTTVIGTNILTMAMENRWQGSSVGTKIIGGLSVLMFDVYGGIGANFNFGDVNSILSIQGEFRDATGSLGNKPVVLEGKEKATYEGFDLRLLLGVHVFVSDIAVEWNPMNNALAFTLVPISLAF